MQTVRFVCLLVVLVTVVWARRLDQCQIARELKQHGFPQNKIADWVCLVMAESSGDTHAIGGPNSDQSHDYGLFQINDHYWCEHGRAGKRCNIDCNWLLSDDISVASKCAQRVFAESGGFFAWYGWQNKCHRKRLPDINYCFKNH